jgi:hypothetical protein
VHKLSVGKERQGKKLAHFEVYFALSPPLDEIMKEALHYGAFALSIVTTNRKEN